MQFSFLSSRKKHCLWPQRSEPKSNEHWVGKLLFSVATHSDYRCLFCNIGLTHNLYKRIIISSSAQAAWRMSIIETVNIIIIMGMQVTDWLDIPCQHQGLRRLWLVEESRHCVPCHTCHTPLSRRQWYLAQINTTAMNSTANIQLFTENETTMYFATG